MHDHCHHLSNAVNSTRQLGHLFFQLKVSDVRGQPEDVTDVDLGDRRDLLGQFSGTVRALSGPPLFHGRLRQNKNASRLFQLLQREVTPTNYQI